MLGPAEDGGYWLVGMRRRPRVAEIFDGVRWSSEQAMADTLENIRKRKMSVAMLESLADIDEGKDLARWRRGHERPRPLQDIPRPAAWPAAQRAGEPRGDGSGFRDAAAPAGQAGDRGSRLRTGALPLLDLLRLTNGRVTAVDLFEPFLEKLGERAEEEGIGEDRLTVTRGDMEALSFEEAAFDLIWSEGAIYLLGFEHGLEAWRKFLKPGGFVAVSECTWLTATPSDEARAFWEAAYPTMGTIASNCEAAVRAGFEIIGTHVLSEDDWCERSVPLRPCARGSRRCAQHMARRRKKCLRNEETEIALFERHPGQYSYVFYVLRRKG